MYRLWGSDFLEDASDFTDVHPDIDDLKSGDHVPGKIGGFRLVC